VTAMKTLPQPTLLGAALRYWAFVLMVVLIGALAGWMGARALAPDPSATAILVVRDPRPGITSDGTAAARYGAEQAVVISSELVIAPTRHLLLEANPPIDLSSQALRHHLTVSRSSVGNVLNITVSDKSGVRAAFIANAFVREYRAVTSNQLEQEASAQLTKIDASIAELQRSIPAVGNSPAAELARAERSGLLSLRASVLAQLTAGDGVTASSPAVQPQTVSSKGALLRGAGLGATVGFLLAALVSYLVASRRRRCERSYEPEMVLAVPCLGTLRVGRPSAVRRNGGSTAASSALSTTTANLLSRLALTNAWSVGFVRDAHDPTAVDALLIIAASAGRLGRRVLVIVAPGAVLTESAQRTVGDTARDSMPTDHRVSSTGLAIRSVPVGDGISIHIALAEPLAAEAYLGQPDAATHGRMLFDVVLVDVAAVSDGREALLSPVVDANVVLVRHNSMATVTERLAEGLSLAGASVIGYVYMRVARRIGFTAKRTTVRTWFDATASPALHHRELIDTD
jgi:capsular polysaccharide biosynthesis protein